MPLPAISETKPTEPVPDIVATPAIEEVIPVAPVPKVVATPAIDEIKPLTTTLGPQPMADIHNRRLLKIKERLSKIKEKIMWWRGNISNPGQDQLVADALSCIETGLLLLNEAVQDTYKDDWTPVQNEVYQATPPDAALTRLLNILQKGLPHPSFTSTEPPSQSCTPSTLPPPTGPPEVTTVTDTTPVDHYSGLTDSVAESSRKPNNLCPVSPHSTVRQKGGTYNNQDYTKIV